VKNQFGVLLKKTGLKKPLLQTYFFVFNTRERFKHIYRSKMVPVIIKKRSKNGILAVDICTEHGLGSKISWCIEILAYCKENQLTPVIRFSYPGKEKDYFEPYFSMKESVNPSSLKFTKISFMKELGFEKDYGDLLTIEEAFQLIDNYITINNWVKDEVLQFCSQQFAGKKVIGVHYRGTDKVGEAPEVPYDKVIRNIQHVRNHHLPNAVVFLSTDDNKFASYLKSTMPELHVIMRTDYQRSDDNQPVHLNEQLDKFEINRDAIINSLLLSHCNFLIKSSSFLSDISKIFNPSLPIVMLNRPYERAFWFPAKEIVKTLAFEQLD
jgi:hypothetical protein